jgi:hypothetical protein
LPRRRFTLATMLFLSVVSTAERQAMRVFYYNH